MCLICCMISSKNRPGVQPLQHFHVRFFFSAFSSPSYGSQRVQPFQCFETAISPNGVSASSETSFLKLRAPRHHLSFHGGCTHLVSLSPPAAAASSVRVPPLRWPQSQLPPRGSLASSSSAPAAIVRKAAAQLHGRNRSPCDRSGTHLPRTFACTRARSCRTSSAYLKTWGARSPRCRRGGTAHWSRCEHGGGAHG